MLGGNFCMETLLPDGFFSEVQAQDIQINLNFKLKKNTNKCSIVSMYHKIFGI